MPVASPRPDPGSPVTKIKWCFSFRFWKEHQNFGLEHSDPKWFVSLLMKLSELSKYDVDDFLEDGRLKDTWRYHPIDWQQQNIPISRAECTWVGTDYLNNEDEYPFVQLQVSQALGRVVGFWDEKQVFNVVLLDPLHNIQPSKRFHYRVDPCKPLGCEMSAVLLKIDQLREDLKCDDTCEGKRRLAALPTANHHSEAVLIGLDTSDYEDVVALLTQGHALREILQEGVLSIMARATTPPAPNTPTSTQAPPPPASPPPP